jgi:uncharacterized protein YbjT (DUF2867 family)
MQALTLNYLTMKRKPTILVTGATGAQGGSVAKALLAENKFVVRILTRNALSEKAIALKKAGAEIAEGDFDDIESLHRAMKDCYGVFGVTSFWEHFGKEYAQGENLINAVRDAGVKHFVFQGLADYYKLSGSEYSVPHCDMKAKLQLYTQWLGIPATFVHMSFYYENFFNAFPLQRDEEGTFFFGFPQGDTPLAMASVEDIGGVVTSIFNDRQKFLGRIVGVVGADEPCADYASLMTKILGHEVKYKYIPRDVYADFGFPGAEELANLFEVQRLHILNRRADLMESYQLNPSMQTFESWLIKNKARFEAYFGSVLNSGRAA